MCGIWAYIGGARVSLDGASGTVKNRGPDQTRTMDDGNTSLVFHRLAINGVEELGAAQPFVVTDKMGATIHIMCNGEIYNYKELAKELDYELTTNSDCEVLCHLLRKHWDNPEYVLRKIKGEFALVAVRTPSSREGGAREVFAARDPFGVRPLYYAYDGAGYIFCSLLSGIVPYENMRGDHFPPGHFLHTSLDYRAVPEMYYSLKADMSPVAPRISIFRFVHSVVGTSTEPSSRFVAALVKATKYRLQSDRPIGFMLSGGLDSSLIVGIAVHVLGLPRPKTFSVGMAGSVDLHYARKVATYLDTDHTEVVFTEHEALAAIPEVIKCLETYDITTIRASIGSFLLAKYIRENTEIKVLLNGDGSDEVACGYLYNYYAPTPEMADSDARRLLREIHKYDGLRVDRTISYHGLEARVPFLDPEYVEAYLELPADERVPTKSRMEKKALRDAFDTTYPGILPAEILHRRKEAFSDGVSDKSKKESMIQRIQRWAQETHGAPEPEVYKRIFETAFPGHNHVMPRYWMPRWTGNETSDPSATTLKIY